MGVDFTFNLIFPCSRSERNPCASIMWEVLWNPKWRGGWKRLFFFFGVWFWKDLSMGGGHVAFIEYGKKYEKVVLRWERGGRKLECFFFYLASCLFLTFRINQVHFLVFTYLHNHLCFCQKYRSTTLFALRAICLH